MSGVLLRKAAVKLNFSLMLHERKPIPGVEVEKPLHVILVTAKRLELLS